MGNNGGILRFSGLFPSRWRLWNNGNTGNSFRMKVACFGGFITAKDHRYGTLRNGIRNSCFIANSSQVFNERGAYPHEWVTNLTQSLGANMRYIALAAAILVTGCANMQWDRPGASRSDAARAEQACAYEAHRATAAITNGMQAGWEQGSLTRECMRVQGWVYRVVE